MTIFACENCQKLDRTIEKLRSALVGLVGSSDPKELKEMELAIRLMPAPEKDKAVTINAIDALLDSHKE
jgi:hypothetical protein